jgi:hypothetical protein
MVVMKDRTNTKKFEPPSFSYWITILYSFVISPFRLIISWQSSGNRA